VIFLRGGDEEAAGEGSDKLDGAGEIVDDDGDEPNEELEDDEDEDISNEDRIVTKYVSPPESGLQGSELTISRLQRLQSLEEWTQLKCPESTQDVLIRWEECCAMFRHHPKETGIDKVITIAGLNTKIYQYQAFGVYWQMVNSRKVGGGFLADDMGLGKTLSFLAYVVVERQLSVLHLDVMKSRAARDGKHLQEGQPGECPSPAKLGWIACPCSAMSPTSGMAPQPGLRMVCVPQGLVAQWWAQWKTHIDVTNTELAMKIVVDHPATFNNINITIIDRLSSGEAAQNTTRIQAEKYGRARDRKGDDRPQEYHEGYLLLTTKETYPKFAKKFENAGQVHGSKKHGDWKTGTRSCLIFGIAMIDESHEEYFKNKGRAQILTNLPTWNNSVRPFVWGYSGTPFSQTPRGIEGVLWAIEKHSGMQEANFKWRSSMPSARIMTIRSRATNEMIKQWSIFFLHSSRSWLDS
jgi:SNF2-related domain